MNGPDHLLASPVQAAALPAVVNHTPWPSQYFQHVNPHGQVFHVMVCRTTYDLRGMDFDGPQLPVPQLLPPEAQPALCEADTFCGAVNETSALQESDFAPFKPRCDVVVVNARAYAPRGEATERWIAGFFFGRHIDKFVQVTGPRAMTAGDAADAPWRPGAITPITQLELGWQHAWGGPATLAQQRVLQALHADASLPLFVRAQAEDALAGMPALHAANPLGCGSAPAAWARLNEVLAALRRALVAAERELPAELTLVPPAAPQIEPFNQPYQGLPEYEPVGMGPVGRWWQPRLALAGTHDEAWRATQWPLSPLDHDYGYWNCAPPDQQIDYPVGGEHIELINLTPTGSPVGFLLPTQPLQLLVRLHAGPMLLAPMNIDTVILDPGAGLLTLVRRALVGAGAGVRALELGTWPSRAQAHAGAAPAAPATPATEAPHGR